MQVSSGTLVRRVLELRGCRKLFRDVSSLVVGLVGWGWRNEICSSVCMFLSLDRFTFKNKKIKVIISDVAINLWDIF